MKKIIQTIKLRKYKTKAVEEALKQCPSNEYLVWYRDNTVEEVFNKEYLLNIIENDYNKPIHYIFDMADRIILDRNILIDIDKI